MTLEALRSWLVVGVAKAAGLAAQDVDMRAPFSSLGLDSVASATLMAELGRFVGRSLSPVLMWQYPSIDRLAAHLAGEGGSSSVTDQSRTSPNTTEPIAVIGIACRFPGAPNIDSYWSVLTSGAGQIRDLPAGRWEDAAIRDAGIDGEDWRGIRRAGYLDSVDGFDASFFRISPREAEQLDPQQRLALEVSWEALEDAGITAQQLAGSRAGVFCGVTWHDYADLHQRARAELSSYTGAGQCFSVLANRISYFLGLQGPSVALDTACSSSLVAVHLACQSLRTGDATLALAGGVNLLLAPHTTALLTHFGGLSPDGCCRPFDAAANGFVRGEGAGMVVLKPLSRAVADGDRIYAVIRGSAVNNDGASNGLTAPNPAAQKEVLIEACRRAGVDPAAVDYVEAHGTGTVLGDPIEAAALGTVYGQSRNPDKPLRIGSVKATIGHLEGAAGIAGLIKVCLMLRKRALLASNNFSTPNPHVDFEALRLCVQPRLEPWPLGTASPLAGVSAFGWGGTNCHVVLEASQARGDGFVALAASDPAALRDQIGALRAEADRPDASLPRICAQNAALSGTGSYRFAAYVRSAPELVSALDAFAGGEPHDALYSGVVQGRPGPTVFVCSPHGSQWIGMGRQLLNQEPVFRSVIERCDRVIREEANWSLIAELLAESEQSRIRDVAVVQPALVCMQMALAAQWRSLGIEPDVVVGHSLGEIAAAQIAGILDVESAARLACIYSRLQQHPGCRGAMTVVNAAAEVVEARIARFGDRVSVAGYNGLASILLSGEVEALDELRNELRSEGMFCEHVVVDVAAHSRAFDVIQESMRRELAWVAPRSAARSMVSTVTERPLSGAECNAHYWSLNVREPVRFAQVVAQLIGSGCRTFVEVSPHPVLAPAIRQTLEQLGVQGIVLPTLRRHEDERATMLKSLCALFAAGHASGVSADAPGTHVLTLSAHKPEALRQAAEHMSGWLAQPQIVAADVCYTAAVRRTHHQHRLAAVGASKQELRAALDEWLTRGSSPAVVSGKTNLDSLRSLVFVFSGQGVQWPGMACELYQTEATFRNKIEECDAVVRSLGDWSLVHELTHATQERLSDTAVALPLVFAIQVGLAELLAAWGVKPGVVVGHSVGEIVAAHVAGALDLQQAVTLIYKRAALMSRAIGKGRMAAVGLDRAAAEALVSRYADRFCVAAINGPAATVLSGEPDAIEAVVTELTGRGVFARLLNVPLATHSPQMEPLAAELLTSLSGLTPHSTALPFCSTVTGDFLSGEQLTADYWQRNMREPVLFAAAIERIATHTTDFIEIGPRPVLRTPLEQSARSGCGVIGTLEQGISDRLALLRSLAELHVRGHAVDWAAILGGGRVLPLPSYPWQRQRYWFERARALVETEPAVAETAETERLVCQVSIEQDASGQQHAAVRLYDASGSLLGEAQNIRLARRAASAEHADWDYSTAWIPACASADVPGLSGTWLICDAGSEIAEAVSARIRRSGGAAHVLRVADLPGVEAIQNAVARLLEQHATAGVLWLADSPADPSATQTANQVLKQVQNACAGVVGTARALLTARMHCEPRFWIVTRQAQKVSHSDLVDPVKAAVWGLGKTVALECAPFWGGQLDLETGGARSADISHLVAAIAGDAEDQVAARGGIRFVPRIRAAEAGRERPQLRRDASYLVTGGTGGIGLELGKWLAQQGAGCVVLLSRSKLPPATEWDDLPSGAPAAHTVASIRAMRNCGAHVVTIAADVGDADAMAGVLERFGRDLPPLRGVFHAAAATGFVPLVRMSDEDLLAMLRPKVAGTWLLHQLTKAHDLDYFVLFSSVAAVWGSRGMGHYGAANQFLDGIAHTRRATRLPALTVNWGGWAGATNANDAHRFLDVGALKPMAAESALAKLGALIASGEAQRIVASVDWPLLAAGYDVNGRRPLLADMLAASARSVAATDVQESADSAQQDGDLTSFARQIGAAAPADAYELMLERVRNLVGDVLKMNVAELMEPGIGFFRLGMDSLRTVELRRRLETELGVRLPATIAFEHPTIERLASHLSERIRGFERTGAETTAEHTRTAHVRDLSELDEAGLARLLDSTVADLLDGKAAP